MNNSSGSLQLSTLEHANVEKDGDLPRLCTYFVRAPASRAGLISGVCLSTEPPPGMSSIDHTLSGATPPTNTIPCPASHPNEIRISIIRPGESEVEHFTLPAIQTTVGGEASSAAQTSRREPPPLYYNPPAHLKPRESPTSAPRATYHLNLLAQQPPLPSAYPLEPPPVHPPYYPSYAAPPFSQYAYPPFSPYYAPPPAEPPSPSAGRQAIPAAEHQDDHEQDKERFSAPKKKYRKDKNKPKRPLSAYNLFFKDQRAEMLAELRRVQEQTANCNGGGLKGKELRLDFELMAKEIGARWRSLDSETINKYEGIASEGRKKYYDVMKEYRKKKKQELCDTPKDGEKKEEDGDISKEEDDNEDAETEREAREVYNEGVENEDYEESILV